VDVAAVHQRGRATLDRTTDAKTEAFPSAMRTACRNCAVLFKSLMKQHGVESIGS
jgi:hypothetical protein